MSKLPKRIGLIAEDESDIESLKELLKKSTGKNNLGFKHFVGRGCGKIKRKAYDWAKQLKTRGCKILIVVHDLDKNNHDELHEYIEEKLSPFVIDETFISIPIEEMESWFLADSKGLKKALNLEREPKVYHNPERVKSPKEVLKKEIEKASGDTKIYINTKHNSIIAKNLDINILKSRCPSFNKLYNFAVSKI